MNYQSHCDDIHIYLNLIYSFSNISVHKVSVSLYITDPQIGIHFIIMTYTK